MFNFTPLLGAQSDSQASQSLLELDGGVKILIDVGWDETFDVEKLQALEKHLSTTSIVLLTHATIEHLGAYAHCCKHFPQFTKIPVYATTPVIALGRTLLQDLYASTPLAASVIPATSLAEITYSSAFTKDGPSPNILLQPPTTDEIAGYFTRINSLIYSQPHEPLPSPFSPPLNGLTITAYNAGHTLGGTIWHIQYGLESIVYAVDWNQAKENILSGAAWLGGGGGGAEVIEQLRRPTALVCSSKGTENQYSAGGRKRRDDTLLAMVSETIKQGGTVLIPSDSSARILELAYILEQHWRSEVSGQNGGLYKNAKVHLASKYAGTTIRYVRSMVEWMDDGPVRAMEAANDRQKAQRGGRDDPTHMDQTPFDFRHVKLVERKTKMDRFIASGKPGVILASDKSLDWGLSKEALQRLANDPKNLVILTERIAQPDPTTKSLSRSLWDLWQRKQAGSSVDANRAVKLSDESVTIRGATTIRLEGEETLYYQQYLARQRQVHSTLQGDNTMSKEDGAQLADDGSSSSSESSEESDAEQQGRALNLAATMNQTKRKIGLTDAELGVNVLLRRKNIYDYDVRGKRGREKVFPFVTRRGRDDDFGDVIRPEDYLRAEEKDEMEGQTTQETQKGEMSLGQKRKWDDVAGHGGKSTKPTNKRTRTDRETERRDDDGQQEQRNGDGALSDSEESDYEPEETIPEGPLKAVYRDQALTLQLRIAYVDFSGLHDKRDLQMLIPLIRPRKLILVAGDGTETLSLLNDCKTLLQAGEGPTTEIFAPLVGECIDASVDTNAWALKLSRDLVKRLAWQNVKGLGVVAVTGRLDLFTAPSADADASEQLRRKKLKMIKGEDDVTELENPRTRDDPKEAMEPVLDVLPSSRPANQQIVSQPIHVGDLRLADLRRLMQASGHTADFRGEGTLLIDEMVVVRKSASGRIEVEGGGYAAPNARGQQHEGTFFAVKRRIYEGLAIVAGG